MGLCIRYLVICAIRGCGSVRVRIARSVGKWMVVGGWIIEAGRMGKNKAGLEHDQKKKKNKVSPFDEPKKKN